MPAISTDTTTTGPVAEFTPVERLARLVEKYEPSEDVIPDEDGLDPATYVAENPLLFVVVSRTGERPWLSLHPCMESAAECWASEECPEYWEPRLLIDLRTGAEFVAAEHSSVSFTPAGTVLG